MNKGPLDYKFKKVMALKCEHKKQILVMNNCQFYCFYVKSVLAKRFEKSFCSQHTSPCTYFFFLPKNPPPLHQRNLESERNIYPPPPHGGSSEYIPRSFHFHTCSQLGRKYSYQQAQHSVSSVIYYQWYESLQREGRKIALSILQHMGSDSLTL